MDRTVLGRTGLDVSVACLGTGGHSRLGLAYGATAAEAEVLVRAALDSGVDFIDTAAAYGTEEIVGRAIGSRRNEVVISTKNSITRRGSDAVAPAFVSGKEYAALVEQSLRRLGTDHVDILHLHGVVASQYDYCVSELVPVLEDLRRQGKIRFTAISERFAADPEHETLRRALQDDHFDVMMVGLNYLNHTALSSVIPAANARNIGLQSMFAVRGTLADARRTQSLIDTCIAGGEIDPTSLDPEPLAFLTAPGVAATLAEACYRYTRHAPGTQTVLTGTGKIDHLEQNLASIGKPALPDATLRRISELFSGVRSVSGE